MYNIGKKAFWNNCWLEEGLIESLVDYINIMNANLKVKDLWRIEW